MRWAWLLLMLPATVARPSRLLDSLHETPSPTPAATDAKASQSVPVTTAPDEILSFILKQSDDAYPPVINRLDAEAIRLYRQDQLAEVIETTNQSLRAMPNDIRALTLRGTAYLSAGQTEAGIADYVQATRLEPKTMPVLSAALGAAYLKQGRRWIERGKKTEARTAFQVSLKWDPKRAGPLSELAHLASTDGNYEDCIQLANRALAQESSYADALGNRGACHFALGQNSEALKDLDRAIEKQPRSAGIRITRAGVYGALGDCRRLAEDTQIAVAVDPTVTESAQALLTRCRHRTDKN